MIPARQRLLKEPQPLDNLVGGIDIEWRSVPLGESFE
jgi:hypothetical protein